MVRRLSRPPLLVVGMLLTAGCSDYELSQFEAQDLFRQQPAGEVDIILVVDNSCSMQPYQAKLGENFDSFLTYLEEGQVEYHIGVLTTTIDVPDAGPGCTQADVDAIPAGGYLVGDTVITNETTGAEAIFDQLVNVGTCGNGFEMGLESAYRALTPPIATDGNLNLLRDTAMMSLIFVSDEEDSSPQTVSSYTNYFRELKGLEDRSAFNASALVVEDTADCSQDQINSGATVGSRYVDVATETNGLLGNICDDDFTEILTELSYRASRLQDTFYLTKLPAPGSLLVSVNDAEVPCDTGDWTYDTEGEGNQMVGKIVFARDSLPPPDSAVNIIYDYGSGDPTDFCLPEGE